MNLIFKDYTKLDEKELVSILELRNQKKIREYMINNEIISLENHLNWIESLKKSTDKKYFSVSLEKEIIGSLSYVNDNQKISWGVFFKENINPFVTSSSTFIFLSYVFEISQTIYSYVKKENLNAFNFNKNFGFKIYDEDENYFYLKLEKEEWENRKNSKLLKPIKNYLDKIDYEFK